MTEDVLLTGQRHTLVVHMVVAPGRLQRTRTRRRSKRLHRNGRVIVQRGEQIHLAGAGADRIEMPGGFGRLHEDGLDLVGREIRPMLEEESNGTARCRRRLGGATAEEQAPHHLGLRVVGVGV